MSRRVMARSSDIHTGKADPASSGAPLESRAEWRADAAVHVAGVLLGLVAAANLAWLAWPASTPGALVSLGVYASGLLAMLVCSALYNIWGRDHPRAFWRRLDHAAIFVMIAGTYTPFLTLAVGGVWGRGLLIFVWVVAVAGVLLKLLHPGRLEKLSIAAYLLLGWCILIAFETLVAAVPVASVVLLVAGGLIYSLGVVIYRWHSLPYHRAIWHAFVVLAAACHYVAVLEIVPA